jgi:hypothetical protein
VKRDADSFSGKLSECRVFAVTPPLPPPPSVLQTAKPTTAKTSKNASNGVGLGASHQTRSTGVIAKLIELFGRIGNSNFWMPVGGAWRSRGTEEVNPVSAT